VDVVIGLRSRVCMCSASCVMICCSMFGDVMSPGRKWCADQWAVPRFVGATKPFSPTSLHLVCMHVYCYSHAHALAGQVITSFGRPDWPKIVSGVADNHPGQTVGVFVCGPPPFCKSINAACQNFNANAATRIKVRSGTSDSTPAVMHSTCRC
jgi:Ferric reductase NAD binding domain